MKFLLFSDLHLDAAFSARGLHARVARRRRQALRDVLVDIIELAGEVGVDAILCGGDLYEETRFTPDTAAFLQSVFSRIAPLPVYIAPGNHDWLSPGSLYRNLEWPENVHIFSSSSLEPVTLEEGLTLWGAAHRAPARTESFLDSFAVDRGGVHLALFHGSERGHLDAEGKKKEPHAPFRAAEIERSGIHHACLGHYHNPCDGARHTYPGNPEPLTFGESGERGAVVLSIAADGSVERARRRVARTAVHDLEVEMTGCRSRHEVRERILERTRGLTGIARVTITGEIGDEIDLRFDDCAVTPVTLEALVIREGPLHYVHDLAEVAGENSVRGEFVRRVMAADLTGEERRRVLRTGMRALDGRDDLEVL